MMQGQLSCQIFSVRNGKIPITTHALDGQRRTGGGGGGGGG